VSTKNGRKNTKQLKILITELLKNFSKSISKDGYLEKYNKNWYYKNGIQFAIDCQKTYLVNILNSKRMKQIK